MTVFQKVPKLYFQSQFWTSKINQKKMYQFSLCIVLVRCLAFVWTFTIFMTFCNFDKWSLVLQSYHFILFLRCKFIHDQNIYYTQIVKTLFCLLRNSLIKQTETLSNTTVKWNQSSTTAVCCVTSTTGVLWLPWILDASAFTRTCTSGCTARPRSRRWAGAGAGFCRSTSRWGQRRRRCSAQD